VLYGNYLNESLSSSLSLLLRLGFKLLTFPTLAAETVGGPASIADWIHFEAIQLLVYHASAVITTLVLSALVCFVIERLMRDGPMKRLIILIDEIFVALVILFLVAELALHLWQK
jgi:hypothetical protein